MERSSNRWLSFLKAHPDPVIVFDEQKKLVMQNDDSTRVLAPEIRDLGLSDPEVMECIRERLFELRVNSYPKNVVLEGSEEDFEPQQMQIYELLHS